MKSATTNLICRLLVVALMMLPFQQGQAGMIGTDQMVSAATAQADRNTVLNLLGRSKIASELQSLGVDPQAARDRVAAMTDQEVHALAGKVNAVPAGADAGLVLLVLVIFIIWYFAFRR